MQYPLSRDEHVAMARCLSGISKQLQDVSDLFATRYGKHCGISQTAVETLRASTDLERKFMLLENAPEAHAGAALEAVAAGR